MSMNSTKGQNFLLKWFKPFIPQSRLRFYPPHFIIRSPIIRVVKETFYQGNEVAVIVFNMKDSMKLKDSLSKQVYESYMTDLKLAFKEAILMALSIEDILMVHNYQSNGVTLLMRLETQKKKLTELDGLILKIVSEVQKKLSASYQIKPSFLTGYMFVNHKDASIEGALSKAHRQANAIAEKKQSQQNDLLDIIHTIISEQKIRLVAQPIFEIATNRIKAYEVLTRGPIGTELESPLALFSVARQTGTLYELERIVLEKTFKQISENGSTQNVFINFTPVTLENPQFFDEIISMLQKYKGVNPKQIVFEVTEHDPISHLEAFKQNIVALRKLGFRVAVDHTGVGYSILQSILEIKPEIIKVDRSVIQDIDKNSMKESRLTELMEIAKKSGSVIIAEGIESAAEAMVLSKNSVQFAQGFYYAKPASVEKVTKLSQE